MRLNFNKLGIIILFLSNITLFSQITNQWEIIDSSDLQYYSYFSFNSNSNLSGFDEDHIVVLGGTFEVFDYSRNRYQVFKFTDKAMTKEIIYQDTINSSHRLHSIIYQSNNKMMVVGDTAIFQGKFPSGPTTKNWYLFHGLILFSNDDGSTWQKQILDSNTILRNVSMCDSLHGIIYQQETDNYYNQKEKYHDSLMITYDGWNTSIKIAVPEDAGLIYNSWCSSPGRFILLYLNRETNRYFLYLTDDKGVTWKKSTSFGENEHVMDVEAINKNIIYVITKKQIKPPSASYEPIFYSSTNSGDSWQKHENIYRNIKDDIISYSDIDFYDSLNGIAGGSKGRILRTSDGAETWDREYTPFKVPEINPSYDLEAVFYPKPEFAFGIYYSKYIVKCTNKKILLKPKFYPIVNNIFQLVNNVIVKWTSNTDADYYRLKIDTIGRDGNTTNLDFENPMMDTVLFDTSITLNNLDYNKTYILWVKAYNEFMESDWEQSEPGFKTIVREGSLYPPALIYPSTGSKVVTNDVTLIWSNVLSAEKYKVDISNSNNDETIIEIVSDTSYYLRDLLTSTYYYVLLSSINSETSSQKNSSFFGTREVLSVENNNLNHQSVMLKISPNPVSDLFNIKFLSNLQENCLIKIYNILGNQVKELNLVLTQGENNIPISSKSLASGLYNIQIITDNEIRYGMFIKE